MIVINYGYNYYQLHHFIHKNEFTLLVFSYLMDYITITNYKLAFVNRKFAFVSHYKFLSK